MKITTVIATVLLFLFVSAGSAFAEWTEGKQIGYVYAMFPSSSEIEIRIPTLDGTVWASESDPDGGCRKTKLKMVAGYEKQKIIISMLTAAFLSGKKLKVHYTSTSGDYCLFNRLLIED